MAKITISTKTIDDHGTHHNHPQGDWQLPRWWTLRQPLNPPIITETSTTAVSQAQVPVNSFWTYPIPPSLLEMPLKSNQSSVHGPLLSRWCFFVVAFGAAFLSVMLFLRENGSCCFQKIHFCYFCSGFNFFWSFPDSVQKWRGSNSNRFVEYL